MDARQGNATTHDKVRIVITHPKFREYWAPGEWEDVEYGGQIVCLVDPMTESVEVEDDDELPELSDSTRERAVEEARELTGCEECGEFPPRCTCAVTATAQEVAA